MLSLDERAFVSRFESANAAELAELLLRPTAAEERTLRIHLGDELHQRLHALSVRQHSVRRTAGPATRNVILLPDFMGSELSIVVPGDGHERIWLDPAALSAGAFERLRLAPDGLSELDPKITVRPSGILKRMYGELMLSLLVAGFHVRAFWYDWRKDVRVSAAQLQGEIDSWFGEKEPVDFIAHGMGGLVARAYIARFPRRWEEKDDASRLVMLGVPNEGCTWALELLLGVAWQSRVIARMDGKHDSGGIARVFASFPGIFGLLPSPRRESKWEALYEAHTYPPSLEVDASHLQQARLLHEELSGVVDGARMSQIVGVGRATHAGPSLVDFRTLDWRGADGERLLGLEKQFEPYVGGDGIVSSESARLDIPTTYEVEAAHAELPSNAHVLGALPDLLRGREVLFPKAKTSFFIPRSNAEEGLDKEVVRRREAMQRIEDAAVRVRAHRSTPSGAFWTNGYERDLAAAVSTGFSEELDDEPLPADARSEREGPTITVNVVNGDLWRLEGLSPAATVDAFALGVYEGNGAGWTSAPAKRADATISERQSLITQLVQRGVIDGRLAKPFMVLDPQAGADHERIIVAMGMGVPGRFGPSEAKLLARELIWLVDRLGKTHLGTTLIGLVHANSSVPEVVSAWLRGVKNGLTGNPRPTLQRITFFERDPRRAIELDDAIAEEASRLLKKRRFSIVHEKLSKEERGRLEAMAAEGTLTRPQASLKSGGEEPMRLTVSYEGEAYLFGAVTTSAAVPERPIAIDPKLVEDANEELVECRGARQIEQGEYLGKLLLPQDLGQQIWSSKPLVLLLDATTARIHWELVARPEYASMRALKDDAEERLDAFLAGRGVTRQLRTTFAPPPEPPPPPQRVLRVLVVADPAEDAHLPGAEEEGAAVADLFEQYNNLAGAKNRVEVVRMFGPRDASRTAVLRALLMRTYDVMHFSGHCRYDAERTKASGWVFSRGELLTARELHRLDRVPRFVFSNACESGITPDRSELRDARLAPNFAESFFARGVSNFICTAWPIDDVAACKFALAVYTALLGMQMGEKVRLPPMPMHEAMLEGRKAIAGKFYGARTWGAYQHYGNPMFRFFDPGDEAKDAG